MKYRPQGTSVDNQIEEIFGKAYDHKVISRLVPFLKPQKKLLFMAISAMLIFVITQSSFPYIIKIGIDNHILTKDIEGLTWVFVAFISIAFINWGSGYLQETFASRMSQGVLQNLRSKLFSHLQKLPMSFYDKTEVGRLMSRMHGDVGQLQEVGALIVATSGELLSLIGIIIFLMIMSFKLAIITLIVVPALFILLIVWQKLAKKLYIENRISHSVTINNLAETINGSKIIQILTRQKTNMQLFDTKNSHLLKTSKSATYVSSGVLPGVDFLTSIAISLVIFFGSQMIGHSLDIGVLIAFVMYVQRFFDPLRQITMSYTQFQRAMASGNRIFEIMDIKPEINESIRSKELKSIEGNIAFNNLTFSYTHNNPVLKNINLEVKSGETLAIVGHTGSGKTTLISLLSRLYNIPLESGSIEIDGINIQNVTRDSLLNQMSIVLQEPFLFSGTIMDNIKYRLTESSREEVINASKTVNAHNFISDLELGYDTRILERGSNLSTGQRQLISFARAILSNPKILILDEATANIDSTTEDLIQNALKNLVHKRTAIIIAHRLSTIRDADKIAVMDQGSLIEVGNHIELIKSNGLYKKLYDFNYDSIELANK
ncbi:MAG: multidrug ABC transporter [Chloroflexi bacterium]|nr:multidrug ABC transporter [Chloroflexota bacterium]|tara:strand:+ start:30775 stop:32583 length:1809 start_codon:yes stop_codon:yes gene_type:complete